MSTPGRDRENEEPPEVTDELRDLQAKLLRRQLERVRDRSPYYRRLFEEHGLDPRDLATLDDYAKWPILSDKTRDRQNEVGSSAALGHPFGVHVVADPSEVVGVGTSSGTTGVPTFNHLYTAADLRLNERLWRRTLAWMRAAPDAVVYDAFGLSLWAVGSIAVSALMNLGVRTVAVGAEGGPKRLLEVARRLRPDVLMCTPSTALRLAEVAADEGSEVAALGVGILYLSGEPGGGIPEVRASIAETYGTERIFDGMVGAVGVAKVSCQGGEHRGLHHLSEDSFLHELYALDGDESIPISDGAVGRVVYTSLLHEARPSIKHATGDVARVRTGRCEGCGKTLHRFTLVGRADDMVIIRGVNVYPEAVYGIVQQFRPTMTGEMRLIVPKTETNMFDTPVLNVEVRAALESGVTREACQLLRERLRDLLRVRVEVVPVAPGSLSEHGRKRRLVEHVQATH